jgi:hypothetical protein
MICLEQYIKYFGISFQVDEIGSKKEILDNYCNMNYIICNIEDYKKFINFCEIVGLSGKIYSQYEKGDILLILKSNLESNKLLNYIRSNKLRILF